MKTYIKFLLNLFFNSLWKTFFVFFGIVLISNTIEQLQFFRKIDTGFSIPLILSTLNTPSVVFEILPFIFLISTQFFFIKLINNRELEILKYSGLNNLKIIRIIGLFSFFLGFILIIFYYNFSSILKSKYLEVKNSYTSDDRYLAVITNNGLWIKDEIDDKINIINAEEVRDHFLNEVLINQFNKKFELIKTIESRKIDISDQNWKILEPKISQNNSSQEFLEINFKSNFDLEKINSLFSNLSSLTIYGLINLRKSYNDLDYSLIEIDSHLYKIISYPVYLMLITILTAIIMFNIGYQKNSLFKIILGIFLSVIIYYISNFFKVLGTTEKIPLLLSIWFPLIILTIINLTFILRLNEK
tara:strand:- start:230 stop:1303 length:1074 start_codon:yes stop_codon:yes gene_type:complete